MQISLDAARHMGYKHITRKQLLNPETNIVIAVKYLEYLLNRTGGLYQALDAYNRGLKNVMEHPIKDYRRSKYVSKIIKILEAQ